jgi:hypothetical protein
MVPLGRVIRFGGASIDMGRLLLLFFPETILHRNPAAANVEMVTTSLASGVSPAVVVPE